MIISINAKNHLTKIQHSCMIKTLRNLGIGGNFLNGIQGIYIYPQLISCSVVTDKYVPLRLGCLLSILLFNIVLEVLARVI